MIWKRIDMTTSGSVVQNTLHPKIFNNIRIGEKNIHVQNVGTEPMMMMAMATTTRTTMMTTMRAYMKCEDDKQQVG